MGLGSIFRFFLHRTVELTVIALLIVFLPNIPPNANFSKSYKVAPARPLEGKLSLNTKLDNVELWHKGELPGPEAFADYNGELYASINGGDIVKLVGNHITPVVKFGKPCKGLYQEATCGRPLGIAFDKSGTLYAADCYYGIFKVDIKTGKKERLVAVQEKIDNKNVTLPNSIAIASNGDLYWTDSSTEFSLQDGIFDSLADGSGRLVHYNAKTKKNTVLINDIHFANGVVLSENEDFVLVAETIAGRILRYHLAGPKKGTHDVFIDGLPGFTDNLKSDGRGGVFVPLVIAVDNEHPHPAQFLSPFPLLRKFLARVLGLIEGGFSLANHVYPHEFLERSVHFIGHFQMVSFLTPKRVSILHVSKTGEILDSLHTVKGELSSISEVHIFKDNLYLGSPFTDYIGRIPLSQVGWEHLKPSVKAAPTTTTTAKPTTTTPKPTTTTTTTTPKPTTTQKPTTTAKPATTTTPKPATTAKPATAAPAKPAPTVQQPAKKAQAQTVKDQPKNVPVKEIKN